MKHGRILLSLASALMVLLGGKVFAQAALKTYQCETEPMRVHVFSSDAVTFNGFADGDSICHLWINANGTYDTMKALNRSQYPFPEPAAKTALASLPGDGFYFGEKQVKYFGLTGGGQVYFAETDVMHPTYDHDASVIPDNYIYIGFQAAIPSTVTVAAYPKKTEVLATATTSVQYEIDADTLFVAFNNVKVFDTGGRAFVMSFQHAITKDGEVRFIPVSMQPQGEPDAVKAQNIFYLNYGLFTNKALRESRTLQSLAGAVTSNGMVNITITKNAYPSQTYRMYPPEACQPVENPSVKWSYMAAADYIEFNNDMTCNEGQACLFILSAEETLTGENLPVDGTEYMGKSKIGSSLFVIRGTITGDGVLWLSGKEAERRATGLKAGTTYYLHAFPYYNQDCAGVKYNKT
ncbi:MAG: hypothetical protein K2O37_04510, partial [Bacteroidales bacterium]|nr:hypothetical protein [Bacteroidales bacterium]